MPEDSSPPPTQPKGPRKVTSLTEIVEAVTKTPPQPDPIVLEFWLPPPAPTKENPVPEGETVQLDIQTRFSPDPWLFGIKYMTEVQDLKRKQEPDEKGVLVNKHPDADVVACAKEVVVSPTWLHNESAIAKLKASVPPYVFAELRRKLLLAVPLDADFFGDYHRLTMPRMFLPSVFGSPNGSGNTPTPSPTPDQGNSSPGPTTTVSEPPKNGVSVSATTSG